MNTIQIDFDVFKEITARRKSEAVSENDVLREVLGLPKRMFERQQADGGAEAQPFCALGDAAQEQLRAGTDAEGIEVLLAHPDGLEAEVLGPYDKVHGVGVIPDLVLARVIEVETVIKRLEAAALTTARALEEVSSHWDAVYRAMRRAE